MTYPTDAQVEAAYAAAREFKRANPPPIIPGPEHDVWNMQMLRAALIAADKAAWRKIEEYDRVMGWVDCWHAERRYRRVGRQLIGQKDWYFSSNGEVAQYGEGTYPTHFRPITSPPEGE